MNDRSRREPGDEQLSAVPDDAPEIASTAFVPASAATPAATPTGTRWNQRELLLIAIAVLLGGAMTSAWLMRRADAGTAAVTASGARPAAAPASTSASSARATWSTKDAGQWVGDRSRGFAVELQAENKITVWQWQVRPVLVVRCLGRDLEVFVFTSSAAKMEPGTDDHTVRIALDDSPEVSERWKDSADHDALFAPDGAAFARQLLGARTLQFGFTPHNASPAVAHFNVAGLEAALAPGAKRCGWK